MDNYEKILAENGIDFTTKKAQRFLELVRKYNWDIKIFLNMSINLREIYDMERKISPNGRWKGNKKYE